MKIYKRNGKQVVRPRQIEVGGCSVIMPSDEQIISAGYEIEEIPSPKPYVPTYEEKVVQLIREKYTIDDEFAILRQRDEKPQEFAEYFAYCEECKLKAKTEIL